MSRYLEEAAAQLRKASVSAGEIYSAQESAKTRNSIAREYAVLAAIEKGLLPAELTEAVLEQISRNGAR